MSNRTQALLLETPIKMAQIANEDIIEDARATRPGVQWKIDLERARLLTESYKQTEEEPMVIRRAKALAYILDNMTIYTRPTELLVGNIASTPDGVCHYPEYQYKWVERETAPGKIYADLLTDEERKELKEIDSYWEKLAIHHIIRKYYPDELQDITFTFQAEAVTPNYEKILRIGLNGIAQEAKERKERLEKEYLDEALNGVDYVKKRNFLDGVIIAMEAGARWGKRYAALAWKQAKDEKDPVRKKELETIASNCEQVPGGPARTFHEALQCIVFIHFLVCFIESYQVGWGIRLDKCTGHLYENDLKAGRITRDQAEELIESLFIKDQETGFLHPPIWSGIGGGALMFQTLNIGGVDAQGRNVCNEVTIMVLDAMKNIRTMTPPLALRWHDHIPKEVVDKTIECLATGMPQPALFNDKVNIPRLLSLGIPLEDAREYSINNCMVPHIPGKCSCRRNSWATYVPIPTLMNAAFGIPPLSGYWGPRLGHPIKDLSKVKSVDEILDATMENYEWLLKRLTLIGNIGDALYAEYTPRPFVSALLDDCIERAQDRGEYQYMPGGIDMREVEPLGINNVADSLAAIKKLVFEEKKFTLPTLVEALKNNWRGYEDIRKMCLDAPKFGNDDDYVDLISREVGIRIHNSTAKSKSNWGSPLINDGTVATSYFLMGRSCAATPDGREDRETLHDGTISPVGGVDKRGPTAVLNSVAKVDPLMTWNHLFNQSFMPAYLAGHNAELFAQYLKTYGDLKIHHIQFSVVSRETLVDAQMNPEKYATLTVRVCGFSAYFIDLNKTLQDSIIARTPQAFA